MSARPAPVAIAAALVLALAGCKVERLRHADSGSAGDTSGTVAGSAVASAAPADSSGAAAPAAAVDTLTGLADEPTTGAAPAATPGDTASVTATADELRELAAALAMPVDGVRPADLHDTYTESRGGGSRPHDALDILAPRGTPVRAATDGRLLKLHESVPGGHMVYAADASGRFILMYGHLDRYADGLAEGMPLRRGQVIGYVGTSGNAPEGTPHLHFAIARGHPATQWWRGTPVNPYPLLVHPGAR